MGSAWWGSLKIRENRGWRKYMNITAYETDVVAWANEQAALIRAGRFELLDLQHIAEEIEDVGKAEKRELANRMIVVRV